MSSEGVLSMLYNSLGVEQQEELVHGECPGRLEATMGAFSCDFAKGLNETNKLPSRSGSASISGSHSPAAGSHYYDQSAYLGGTPMGNPMGAVRWATKKAGGTAKQKDKPLPKNLGTKMYGGELIFPGQIIVRQRGTTIWPGYNVGIGRDFTLFAKSAGFVKFTTQEKRSAGGDLVHSRKQVNVVPVNGDWSPAYKEVEAEMVKRRAMIKRQMVKGYSHEPAFFFPIPAKTAHELPVAKNLKPVAVTKQALKKY
eukprot:gene26548-18315_t